MDLFPVLKELAQKTPSKILLIVLDGVGGLPLEPGGPTELEAAKTPNLDRLAEESALGLLTPVYPGLAPGSGPGHLALFGYDPFRYVVGRGALSALGLGADFREGDVALRGNFATLDPEGKVVDRRAGRPPTEENQRVVTKLKEAIPRIEDVEVHFYTESEHRFLVILRGEGLEDKVTDTDPQKTGLPPLKAKALDEASEKTARIVNLLSERIREVLRDEPRMNGALFRGASKKPSFPRMQEVYKLTPAAIASYPMYKGLASLVGMEVLPVEGEGDALEGKLKALKENWGRYDFFYFHVKKTDAMGEDGNFRGKVEKVELFDTLLPEILALGPDVLAITGDHSTPALLKAHSWHPVPLLLKAPYLRADEARRFTEKEALKGSLGHLRGVELMPLLLAHAGKLLKYGA
ncbi:putative 2,3-bisphosphoglycerate-independent phosphoglycerate mutase [Thermus thermophilus]|uniref:Probable 2,3-bisphosphoglycerate-independent phosphoglycerate mutase n=1 Tax=Thermus thermophilus TaxID=274 RepID=A0AAD1KSC7_THETH|nr:2,3-bisphosphoglycerate-independent phosphoglycerate mutase [Thermus thermophilus]BBL81506.1 putative 2,3-bisphosphoglycerate-independent phosphoglycerate mutase [Thermus thermophilus]BBL83809.1 putative 2,3-bisphosphoglycerate-independent phosphoglycerate mutase [Thermus thermophilus]BCZ86113.1 putative 2,3-bisphosphoglycerate-independent phosphoglycerate mutase [Thermus thermophilus]BCZ88492.1 putative 2,3-bisphosphoglycerate-independent phosphoglycerate mutase [Thermus thermophilus]BCZ91